MPLKTVIFVPARHASTRYPGKPLAMLTGATGEARSLIHRSWAAACRVKGVSEVYVTTDDDRIAEAARGFGADVVMTSSECRNGTERCAEAAATLGTDADIIVNLQGDAPLTPPDYIVALVAALEGDAGAKVATPVLKSDGAHLARLKADRMAGRVGGTTAVMTAAGRALYFSKEVVPYTATDYAEDADTPVWHHIGIYAYRRDALAAYSGLSVGTLETLEGLEQLRFLEAGWPVACVPVEDRGRAFWEVNNPSDIAIVEGIMQREGIA